MNKIGGLGQKSKLGGGSGSGTGTGKVNVGLEKLARDLTC